MSTYDLAEAMKLALGFPAEQADADATAISVGNSMCSMVKRRFVLCPRGMDRRGKGRNVAANLCGKPSGLVVSIRNGPTIYHTGDTDLFSDIARVSDYNQIDFMLVCIGDHFTMGPIRAADAVKAVNPRNVVPIHYATFPVLTGTPEEFARELEKLGSKQKCA